MMGYRGRKGRRVLVQLPDMTIEGTLERAGRRTLRLMGAKLVDRDRAPTPIDGEVVVERAQVSWVQVL